MAGWVDHIYRRQSPGYWRRLFVLSIVGALMLGMIGPPAAEAQGGCENLLPNGGFEAVSGWLLPPTPSPAVYSQERVYSGDWSLRTGIPDSDPARRSDSLAILNIALPAAETLTLRMQVWRSGNLAETDFHYVWIKSGGRTYTVFQERADDETWQEVTYDLTPLAGRTVQLLIGTFNTSFGERALMYVDDVSIATCPLPTKPEAVRTVATTAAQTTALPTTTPPPTPIPTMTPTPATGSEPIEEAEIELETEEATAETPVEPTPVETPVPDEPSTTEDGTAIPASPTVEDSPTPTPTPTPSQVPSPTATATQTNTPAAVDTPTVVVSPTPAERTLTYGVNAYLWADAESAERNLVLADQAGFSLVRQRFTWNDLQPEPETFAWETADRVVQQANEAGLTLLVQLTPAFSDPDFWGVPVPEHRPDFGQFVAAVAARYNCSPAAVGCVQAYQIGEEPNRLGIWGDAATAPQAYAALLGEAYTAVKENHPEALVVSAGMAPVVVEEEGMSDITFYERLYDALADGSAGHFDLLGVNAYTLVAPPEVAADEAATSAAYGQNRIYAFRHVEDVRAVMVEQDDTETGIALFVGWPARAYAPVMAQELPGEPIDEFVKADYLVRALVYAADVWQPWLELAVVLTLPDPAWFADGNPFDEDAYWWAIAEPSAAGRLRLRPAYVSLCQHLRPLREESCPYTPNAPASAQP